MDKREGQMLLASANYYDGAIDGDVGTKTRTAIRAIEQNARDSNDKWAFKTSLWTWERRLIAAGQAVLNAQGYEAGSVDGLVGHNTREALIAWLSDKVGTSAGVEREPELIRPDPVSIPRQKDCASFYGQPGTSAIEAQMTYAEVGFPLRIDWDLGATTQRLRVHRKCAPSLVAALNEVHEAYGLAQMQELGIDRYAGGFNPRRMRGGSAWSMHAYGCAVDFYAQPNGLRTRAPRALFSQAPYRRFLDIMETHGWLNGGRLWGADYMHFQQARL